MGPAVPGFAWHHSANHESPPPLPIPWNIGATAPVIPLPFGMSYVSPPAELSRPMPLLSNSSTDMMSYTNAPLPIPLHSWPNVQHISRGYGSTPSSIQAPMTYTSLASYPSYSGSVRSTSFPPRRSISFPPNY